MGISIAAVATLLVISVKKFIVVIIASIIKIVRNIPNTFNCSPSHKAGPLDWNPAANAKPPPKSNNMPEGIVSASRQSIIPNLWDFFG